MQLFLVFVVALSITAALIPGLARLAPGVGLTDKPGPRKVHAGAVPRIGGIAMAAGILVPALLMVEMTPALRGLVAGVAVLLVFGVWDDRANLGYRAKLAGQVLAIVLCMIVGDVRIEALTFVSREPLPEAISWALTFVFLVGVTNAVNLADGLDGLAGGMSLLCLAGIAVLAAVSGDVLVTSLALIEAGAILGFLRFNTHPARVFMGDAGSQVLGFTIGALAILATQGEAVAVSAALPLLLIGVPILDTLAVMMLRIREGHSPFVGDRNHLHHKLLYLGFEHRQAVVLIYLLQTTLFLLAFFLRFDSDLLIITVFAGLSALTLLLLRWLGRSGWRAHAHTGRLSAGITALPLSALSLGVMATGLVSYIAIVLAMSGRVGGDVGLLCLGLLAAVVLLSISRIARPLSWFDRAVAYVCVVLIVYLDQTARAPSELVSTLVWALLGITGAAALVRFWFSRARRFEITSLDLLVVFISLVVPNLPGAVALPEDLTAGIAKTVILLYVVEMLFGLELERRVPRAVLALTLGIIAVRALVIPGLQAAVTCSSRALPTVSCPSTTTTQRVE